MSWSVLQKEANFLIVVFHFLAIIVFVALFRVFTPKMIILLVISVVWVDWKVWNVMIADRVVRVDGQLSLQVELL